MYVAETLKFLCSDSFGTERLFIECFNDLGCFSDRSITVPALPVLVNLRVFTATSAKFASGYAIRSSADSPVAVRFSDIAPVCQWLCDSLRGFLTCS